MRQAQEGRAALAVYNPDCHPGVLGILAGPAVLISAAIAGVVAKFGFNCRFELVKADGTIEEILGEECETCEEKQDEQNEE